MTTSPNRLLGVILGGAFVVLGGLGFVVSSSVGFVDTAGVPFLGLLQVNGLQNSIHVLVGAALVMAALSNQPASATTNAWTGALLLVLGLVGLFLVGEPHNVLALNSAGNVLHFGAAAVLLAAGLGAENGPVPAPTRFRPDLIPPAASVPAISRSWVAFAAVGAGLIHLALVIEAPLALGIPLALLGLTEFGWGVLTFAREQLLFPRIAVVVAVAPVVLWALLLAVAPSAAASLGFLPLAVSSLFGLIIAALLGRHLRRKTDAALEPPTITRYLLGLAVAGLVIAALTTPALASTEAGGSSVPDGLFLPTHGH